MLKKSGRLLQKENRKWIAVGGMGVLVAVILTVFCSGLVGGDGTSEKQTETTESEESMESETLSLMQELSMSEEEVLLLSRLYHAMAGHDYDEAAAILNDHEEQIRALLDETLEGKAYYYLETETASQEGVHVDFPPEELNVIAEMGLILPDSDFTGMALTRYNTVFYGEFSGGKPDGEGAAIQTIILDQPRYSYAEGSWYDGKLNGEGKAGYCYYQSAPESGFVRAEKRGIFSENLLDSDFVYETESGNGEQFSWNMKAESGVTVITDAWEYYPYRKEYMLKSAEDSGRSYVLAEDKVTEVLWNNLIVWSVP